jgi:hypothetical protein
LEKTISKKNSVFDAQSIFLFSLFQFSKYQVEYLSETIIETLIFAFVAYVFLLLVNFAVGNK